MAPKIEKDVLTKQGLAGIMLAGGVHPVTGEQAEPTEQFYTAAKYDATGPGMRTFYALLVGDDRKLHPAHGEKSPDQVVIELFAERLDGGEAAVLKALKNASTEAKKAMREAKAVTYREQLAKLNVQDKAKAAFAKIKAAEAALAKAKDEATKLRTATAEKLSLDGTFEIALVETGFYIPSETPRASGGTKTKVKRDWLASDTYTLSKSFKGGGPKYTAEAVIKNRDANDPEKGDWKVVYTCQGKKYIGSVVQDTLNAANDIARSKMIAEVRPGYKASNFNCPKEFGVPEVTAQAD